MNAGIGVAASIFGITAALLASCTSSPLPARTCYRQVSTADNFRGSVVFASSVVNASGDISLDELQPGVGVFPPNLPTSFDFKAAGAGQVEFDLTFHAVPDPDPDGVRDTWFTIVVKPLPVAGSHSLQSLGVCMTGCPPEAPFVAAGRCYAQPGGCLATACDAGADATSDAGGVGGLDLVCTIVNGTLVVATNTKTDCRSDNTIVEGVRGGDVCRTDFQATLTIVSTDGAAAHVSGTFNLRWSEDYEAYACSFND